MDKIDQKPVPNWAFEINKIPTYAFLIPAFTPEECKKIINYAEQFNKTNGILALEKKLDLNIRESKIVWITPEKEIEWVYERLTAMIIKLNEDYFKFDLFGFIESLQFTEYNAPSGHYEKHIDIAYYGTIRKLSFSLQLSDPKDYEGGELHLHLGKTPEVMKKEQGALVLFPSATLHEVTPVAKGTRYSLVGWITGKPFR